MSIYFNGYQTEPVGREQVTIKNPANGEAVGTLYKAAKGDGRRILENSREGFLAWSAKPMYERTDILMKYVELLGENKERLGNLLCREMGKIISEAMGEAVGTANISKAFIQHANHLYGKVIGDNQPGAEHDLVFTRREPLGTILCIVPFNFPLELYAHKVIPALIMGNAVIIKVPSGNPLALIEMTKLLVEAGVPAGAAQVIYSDREFVTEEIIKTDGIQAVSLTGSTAAGIAVQRDSAPFLHRVFLELGGNDALIICEDADIDYAVEQIYWGRLFNVGQTCCASKRFLVHRSIHDVLVEKLCARIDKMRRGDPSDTATEFGCMHAASAARTVYEQVQQLQKDGAKLVYGGTLKNETVLEPAVLTNVTRDMEVAKDLEIFGPVIPIIAFDTTEEAIEIANQSMFGLMAGVVTRDALKGLQICRQLEAGGVVANGNGCYRHFDMPYGGYKKSGIGREGVSSTLEEFSQEKTYVLHGVF